MKGLNATRGMFVRMLVEPFESSSACSATLGLLDVPRIRTLVGTKAFSVAGPKAWNSLPQSIRDLQSAATFKRYLKTYLFDIACS